MAPVLDDVTPRGPLERVEGPFDDRANPGGPRRDEDDAAAPQGQPAVVDGDVDERANATGPHDGVEDAVEPVGAVAVGGDVDLRIVLRPATGSPSPDP